MKSRSSSHSTMQSWSIRAFLLDAKNTSLVKKDAAKKSPAKSNRTLEEVLKFYPRCDWDYVRDLFGDLEREEHDSGTQETVGLRHDTPEVMKKSDVVKLKIKTSDSVLCRTFQTTPTGYPSPAVSPVAVRSGQLPLCGSAESARSRRTSQSSSASTVVSSVSTHSKPTSSLHVHPGVMPKQTNCRHPVLSCDAEPSRRDNLSSHESVMSTASARLTSGPHPLATQTAPRHPPLGKIPKISRALSPSASTISSLSAKSTPSTYALFTPVVSPTRNYSRNPPLGAVPEPSRRNSLSSSVSTVSSTSSKSKSSPNVKALDQFSLKMEALRHQLDERRHVAAKVRPRRPTAKSKVFDLHKVSSKQIRTFLF